MKMIESELERIVVEKIRCALDKFSGVAVVGTWQAQKDDLKGREDAGTSTYVGVKAFPRSYETPTVPYAEIQFVVTLGT